MGLTINHVSSRVPILSRPCAIALLSIHACYTSIMLLHLYHVIIGNLTLRVQQTAMFIYKSKQQQGECKYGRVK